MRVNKTTVRRMTRWQKLVMHAHSVLAAAVIAAVITAIVTAVVVAALWVAAALRSCDAKLPSDEQADRVSVEGDK